MDSFQLIGDPYCQVFPCYAETVLQDSSSTTATTSFLIYGAATFTKVHDDDDDDEENLLYNTGESVTMSQTLEISLETMIKDDDTEAKAAIDAWLEGLHVPSCLFYLTHHIVSCGRTMWNDRDHGLSHRFLCLEVSIHVFVDQLPVDLEDQTAMIRFEAASKESIEGLERVRIEDEGGDHMVVSCSVCLEDVLVGSEAIKLPCSHLYHKDCIVEWLQSSKFCPLCRFEIA